MTHWSGYAKRWDLLGSPLRPCPEDISHIQEVISRYFHFPLDGLLLGVTPEIASIECTPSMRLKAVEKSEDVIKGIWPGDTPDRQALCANWLDLPFAEESFDLVLGDGSLNNVSFKDYERLFLSVSRVLRPSGYLFLRLYCRTEPETMVNIFSDLLQRQMGSFNALKLRLMLALQDTQPEQDLAVVRILEAYQHYIRSSETLAKITGWPLEVINTVEGYRGSPVVYSFPTLGGALQFLDYFDLIEVRYGKYELARNCPSLLLRKKA